MKAKFSILTLLVSSGLVLAAPADAKRVAAVPAAPQADMVQEIMVMPPVEPQGTVISEFVIGKASGEGRNAQFTENAKTYSRAQKDDFCWGAKITGTDNKQVAVIEEFDAPAKSIFTSDDESKLTTANNGKYWKLETMSDIDSDDYVEHCWTVADNDVLGAYTMTVTIDGQKQKPYKYSIVK